MSAEKPFIKTFFNESSDFQVQIFNMHGSLRFILDIVFEY